MSTIFALSTAAGRSAVAIIRVSGPAAFQALAVLQSATTEPLVPMRAVRRDLWCPRSHSRLDQALVLPFKGPQSFTREDVIELQVHGSPAVVRGTLEALGGCEGLIPAAPGEFSKRAFLNGKMDLTEVEAVADLIEADTTAQREQALRQLSGSLGNLYGEWRKVLRECLARFEACIDFGEEEHLATDLLQAVQIDTNQLKEHLKTHLCDNRRGEITREGLQVVVAGSPNAGKSSLLNQLAGREVAIVSALPGTTRDVLEVRLDLGGYPVVLSDTAGIHDRAADIVEQEGIRRAIERIRLSQLKIHVVDATTLVQHARVEPDDDQTLTVLNKVDLLNQQQLQQLSQAAQAGGPNSPCLISCTAGDGLDDLVQSLAQKVAGVLDHSSACSNAPVVTRARHREHLTRCLEALQRFDELSISAPEIGAEELRIALRELGQITGHVGVEELLGVIFSEFCIGK